MLAGIDFFEKAFFLEFLHYTIVKELLRFGFARIGLGPGAFF
jgi:hypothetical protein